MERKLNRTMTYLEAKNIVFNNKAIYFPTN